MNYFKHSRFIMLIITAIASLCFIVPSFAQNNDIEAEVNKLFDTIPIGFTSCVTDEMIAPSKEAIEVTEKLASLNNLGEGVIPVLVANITSDKNSDKFMGGNSFASLCALSVIAKGKLNFNRVYEIIDDFYPNKIYAATHPDELNRKIQLEIIHQLGNIDCIEQDQQARCWLK